MNSAPAIYWSNGYRAIDCPGCRQEVRVDLDGDRLRFTCRGDCGADIAALVDVESIRRSLARGVTDNSRAVTSNSRVGCSFLRDVPPPRPHVPEDDEPAVVDGLLESHELDGLEPVEVELPPLPPSAPLSAKRVAEFYKLVRGLRLLYGEERPVPFACEWVGGHVGLSSRAVWKVLQRLVAWGVLRRAAPLPGRNKRGTHCFLPGEPRRIEGHLELDGRTRLRPELAGQPVEPAPELGDESLVSGTELEGEAGCDPTASVGSAAIHGQSVWQRPAGPAEKGR